MVLFKRKPVKFPPPVEIDDEDMEVWHIPQTGEVFTTYESYLHRMDFYRQKKFNDQITGHSGLTFFEAYESETAGAAEVEATFPEALKGPILRKVQFQIVSRLDNLVDVIYDEFKADYFPGEEVSVTLDSGERAHGLVRDKTAFGPRVLPDGTRTLPSTRYLVNLKDSEDEAMVTDGQISRDRGVFTKAMLRSFIKRTVMREAWTGAPWLVKHDYAVQYYIDTRIPPHLRYDTKLQERKQAQAQKRDVNGEGRLPELKPSKGQKSKGAKLNGVNGDHSVKRESTPPPAIKYPIEDLQLQPNAEKVRPALRFMCRNAPGDAEPDEELSGKIDMESVGPLLETWDTLNVYCEIFKLDSFTFDDFVQSMSVASEELVVQLFEEIHCSVLKLLVDAEADGGKVRITLPDIDDENSDEEDEDEDGDEEEQEEEEEEEPEPEIRTRGRATRSSLAKREAEKLAAEAAAAEEESILMETESKRRAEEAMKEFDWIDHLRKRNFPDGGWERIVVGLLHQLSKDERHQALCEELLATLVPEDTDPTPEAVAINYANLDINNRVKILQLLCMLTMETKSIRGYMDTCNETMTKYRKERVEWQRQKKQALEDLRQLNEQRKILLPDNMPPEEEEEEIKKEEEQSMIDADDAATERDEEDEDEDEDSVNDGTRKKRRGRNVVDQRRKREEEAAAKKAKEKADKEAAKASHQSKQFTKLLKEISKKEETIKECEDEIAVLENDLREADCPRTRVLGKDRFWNRYYWFERNGMPYAGLPDSSTAEAGYANGRIWIQGPDELEREGYIDVDEALQKEYRDKFSMTVAERKATEEGATHLYTARQWGYIGDVESLDELIKWLDPRGFNELRLRKELTAFRDKIAEHMDKRKEYLTEEAEEDEEDKNEGKRTSSRIRDKTPDLPSYRCLEWENSMVLEELGHLHGEPPPPPRLRKGKKREAVVEVASPRRKSRRT